MRDTRAGTATLRGVNLVLFEPAELGVALPRGDRRAEHVLTVLRRQIGDTFDAGVVNGPRGKATVTRITPQALEFTFAATVAPSEAPPVTLLVGLPRPQTARDVLRDATTLGVGAIHFVRTEKSEASYAQSSLWRSDEWRRHVVLGAEQAFDPRLPMVRAGRSLSETLASDEVAAASEQGCLRLALDNYESSASLFETPFARGSHVVVAIGSERGWSAGERVQLGQNAFTFVHLGQRVLRTETAVVAALSLVRAKLGLR